MAEQRRKELYAKQGRGNQFRNREERDTWIKSELKTLQRGIQDKETQIVNLREEIDVSKNNQQELEAEISVRFLTENLLVCFPWRWWSGGLLDGFAVAC